MIKRYFTAFLATVLMLNTTISSIGSISYVEEQQTEYSSELYEADEAENKESIEESQEEVISSTFTEDITKDNSEVISVVDNESSTSSEDGSLDEVESENVEKSSVIIETEENTKNNETEEDYESTEISSEVENVSETESISEVNTSVNEIKEMELDYNMVELYVGETQQIKAVVKSDNDVLGDILWTSSDNTVATVANGKITAVGVGETTITAELPNESIGASCQVKVLQKKVGDSSNELTLNYIELTMKIGDYKELTASFDNDEIDYRNILWETENKDIAYVEKGYVYAISEGTTTITGTYAKNNLKTSCKIIVTETEVEAIEQIYELSASNSGYNANAALAYAEAHYNDGVGLCAEFVSRCINAGGINVFNVSCTALRKLLLQSGTVTEHTVNLSGGYLYKSDLSGSLEPGDIVFYYCSAETDGKPYVHVVLCNGFDSSGMMKAYAHNSPKNGKTAMCYPSCGYCKHSITTAHVFHFNGNGDGSQPIGNVELISGGEGTVQVTGWAFDYDNPSAQLDIHVYIGGQAYTTKANLERTDVNQAYGGNIGNYHGFNATFKVDVRGSQKVEVYALDVGDNWIGNPKIGEKTITIRKPNIIEYSVSQVNLSYKESQKISFTFEGDGIYALDIATGDGRIAQARFDSIDWDKGIGYVNISSDCAVGKTDLTISFLDSGNNKVYRKSIPITVTGSYNIKFSTQLNYIREKEECLIDFNVNGAGASNIVYEISDTSVAMALGWREDGYNKETGECGVVVKGLKKGVAHLTIKLLSINGDVVYMKSCSLLIQEGLDISFENDQMKVSKANSKSYSVTYKGYGVSDIDVFVEDSSIAKVLLSNKDITNGSANIDITGCGFGETKIFIKLLNAKGEVIFEKSAKVVVQEAFNIQLDNYFLNIWQSQLKGLYYRIKSNYQGRYEVSYEILDGDGIVEIVSYEGDENDGRQIVLRGLNNGFATLRIYITGMQEGRTVVLYEKNVLIIVCDLKVSSQTKTVCVGETFKIDSYYEPIEPVGINLEYTSSDSTIASVSEDGIVTAKKEGTTNITVTTSDKKQSAICKLTVVGEIVNVTGISVFPSSKELTVGDTFTLDAVVQPMNATDNNVSYLSSDEAVAMVDKFGRVKAVGVGNAKITVTSNDGNKKSYCDITVNAAIVATGKTGDLNWKIIEEKEEYTLIISGIGAMADYSSSNVPDWYQYNGKLKHLILEEGITKIGKEAFCYCDSLIGELKLPSSLRVIDDRAFLGCDGFEGELHLPSGMEYIGVDAFYNCTGFRGDIIIPEGIEQIESGVFYRCNGFDGEIVIPDSVKLIGESAFKGCSGVSGNLVLPEGLTCIELNAFWGCNHLSGDLVLPENLTKIGKYAFSYCSGLTGDIIIPNGISRISEGMFNSCTGLNGILKLPENVEEVEASAFAHTRFSDTITIPKTVAKIGSKAFYDIPRLTIYFEGDAPIIEDKDSPYASFSEDVQVYYLSEKNGWSTPEWNGYTAQPASDTMVSIPVSGIGIGVSGEYLDIGDSWVLEYWLIPENTTETEVVWESSDVSVATVDENGIIKAVGYGEAYITVSTQNGKYSKQCDILVVKQPDSTLYVNFDEPDPWMWVGETKTFGVHCGGRFFVGVTQTVYDSEIAEFVDWGETKYTTEGEGIHTQRHEERSMNIAGIGVGKAKVGVILFGGRSNLLYQNNTEITIADLQLSENYIEMKAGETNECIQASVYPEIGIPIQVVYESSDETVVTVDAEGILTALKPGKAIITVTSADGKISKQCEILVHEGEGDKEIEQLMAPFANIESGSSIEKNTKIVLTCEDTEAKIYYTMDGSVPTINSTIYKQPIELVEDTIIKAFAAREGYKDSEIITLIYSVVDSEDDSKKESYKITFELQGHGIALEEYTIYVDIPKGSTISRPTSPEAEGFQFTGWYKEPECKTLWDFEKDIVESDTILYAGWKSNNSSDDNPPSDNIPDGIWLEPIKDYCYTGKPIIPTVSVYYNKKKLTAGQDYTVTYKNNTKAAQASATKAPTVIVKGKNNYSGTKKVTFTINKIQLTEQDNLKAAKVYPAGVKYTPIVTANNNILKSGIDYKLIYLDADGAVLKKQPTKSGNYQMHITGKGNCEGEILFSYTVSETGGANMINQGSATVSNIVYGSEKPQAALSVAGKTLLQDTDYIVSFSNTHKKGAATATFIGIGNYTGTLKKNFKVQAAPIQLKDIYVAEAAAYEKGGTKADVSVTVNGKALVFIMYPIRWTRQEEGIA